MSSTTQQALIIPSPKAPFVVGSLPVPVPLPGQVRVKIMSVGLNPMNNFQHRMDLFMPVYPAVIGADISGVVDEVGEGVQGFEKGDEILVQAIYGGFQQYTVVPAATLIRKPKNINFDEAATFPITFTTACVGLLAPEPIGLCLNPSISWDKPQKGQSALVIGGGSSVGQFAIQLLEFLGFTRIVVYASNTHFDYLKTLGATEFIDRKEVPVESIAHVMKPAVHVVYDSTGAVDAAVDSVVDGGKVATSIPTAKPSRDFESRGITFNSHTGLYAGPDVMKPVGDPALHLGRLEHTEFGRILIRELPKLIEQSVVVGNRVEIVLNGLAGVPDALDRISVGAVRGVKLVAHPQYSV
ncbi:GroES-like protein [Favolaschia claudopus]|uniref:GroES-like protein n=1 Tax=Favolaschia claudopus TaxID=2862362 RepID=A0AAV9ZW81_9AGAR